MTARFFQRRKFEPPQAGEGTAARSEHDLLTIGIALAAIVLFIGTASVVMPMLITAWSGTMKGPDVALTNALLLNIALILLGWNRNKALQRELVARRASEQEARKLAEIDHLTGALNRRSFVDRLHERVRGERGPETAIAVFAIDLDNFKQVNDLNGHQAGDEVLRCTAARALRLLPEGGMIARLGGDEFACLMPYHPRLPDRLDEIAARLIDQISAPVPYADGDVEVTLSIGIASTVHLGDKADSDVAAQLLLHKADIAMYHAKKQGKNRFYWFEPSMEHELRYRNELEAGIRRGIARGEFQPFYEQQIDLETGRLTGFEMLARWVSPELGVVQPDVFIPIAEDIGAIGELSEGLIARAFEDAKKWDADLSLSVNISPVQMRDPWFAQKLLKLLVQHNFPPSRLDIEITESCLNENIGMVRSMITSLRNQGVQVSLDDFGTGYSALSQLRSMQFDRLKIDKSFIAEMGDEAGGAKLVDAIISMSDGMQLPVTAEGIENAEMLEALRAMGKMKGQGYHYGRPEAADAVLDRLAAQGLLAKEDDSNVTAVDFTAARKTGGDPRSADSKAG